MKLTRIALGLGLALASVAALAEHLRNGTEVLLRFDQPLSSKTARAGDRVRLHVAEDVYDTRGNVAIRAGTPAWGEVEAVRGRSRFGLNARIRLNLDPVNGIPLAPSKKGAVVGGTRTNQAAAVSGGAALIFGPLGLAGGYFVVGHNVNIRRGDELRSEVQY